MPHTHSFGSVRQPAEMNDVVEGHLVIAPGDVDLPLDDPVMITLALRLAARVLQIQAFCGSVRFIVPVHSLVVSP